MFPFRAPPNFRSQVPNFYCLCGPAPPGFDFAYYCHAYFHTQSRFSYRGIFSTPLLQRVPCLLAASFAALRSPIWARITIRQLAIFLPACCTSIIGGFRVSIPAGLSFFHRAVLAVPVLIGWFEDSFADHCYITLSSCFRISCTVAGSFFSSSASDFQFAQLLGRACQYLYVACQFLEKFASGSVLTPIRSDSIPVPIRLRSVLFAIAPLHRST